MNLPSDIESERAILGAIFLDNSCLGYVISEIEEKDFFHAGHRTIFRSILSVANRNEFVDAITVGTGLNETDKVSIGGVAYLSTLTDHIAAISAVKSYIRKVRDCSIRRDAILAAKQLSEICSKTDISPKMISELTERIRAVETLNTSRTSTVKLSSGIGAALDGLSKFASGDNADRIPVGIKKVDNALRGGMMPGAMYLIGAPSGGGKTTLTQNVAINCARSRGPVLWVSPEMTVSELTEREIIRRSGISLNGRGPWVRWEEEQENAVAHMQAACQIEDEGLPVFCIDDMNIGMSDVSAKARGIKGIKLIIIDYAQELAEKNPRLARYLAVGNVGRDAIKIGREFRCPVMVTSQVNVSDGVYTFRESGDLFQRAHVAFIMETKWSKSEDQHGYFQLESAKLISQKNRSGPKFAVPIKYEPAIYRISEMKPQSNVWTPTESKNDY